MLQLLILGPGHLPCVRCVSGAGFGPLHLDLLNRKQRVEDRRSNGFHASVVIGDTDDKYLNDAETFVLRPSSSYNR
jgi:hypothetical protein